MESIEVDETKIAKVCDEIFEILRDLESKLKKKRIIGSSLLGAVIMINADKFPPELVEIERYRTALNVYSKRKSFIAKLVERYNPDNTEEENNKIAHEYAINYKKTYRIIEKDGEPTELVFIDSKKKKEEIKRDMTNSAYYSGICITAHMKEQERKRKEAREEQEEQEKNRIADMREEIRKLETELYEAQDELKLSKALNIVLIKVIKRQPLTADEVARLPTT